MPHALRHAISILLAVLCCTAATGQGLKRSQPVFIEDSLAAQQLVDKARDLHAQGRSTDAIGVYQTLIEEHRTRLIAQGDDRYIGAARWVARYIGSDQQLYDLYRRLYEPVAERLLAEASASASPAADLAQVAGHYGLCRSGLEANLRLAAVHLESGRMAAAAAVLAELDEHRDLPHHASRYHLLQAAVGLFADEPQRYVRHRGQLEALADAQALGQLESWSTHLQLPISQQGAGAAGGLRELELPDPFGEPLWSQPIVDQGAPTSSPGARQRLAQPALLQPVAAGQVLYVVARQTVAALDRNSGDERWTHRFAGEAQEKPKANARNRRRRRVYRGHADARSACVVGSRVLAIIGSGTSTSAQAAVDTSLVCLDADDGNLLWRVKPGELDDSFDTAYFHGTPLAAQGRVIVAVRRTPRTSIQDAYIVAVDVPSGKLAWQRHLASAGPAAALHASGSAPTQWRLHDGKLYVCDAAGVACCIDVHDGSVLWLTRLALGGTQAMGRSRLVQLQAGRISPRNNRVRQTSQPFFIEKGLVVPTFDRSLAPYLLDPRDGMVTQRLTGPGWSGASYYLPAGSNVISIGATLRLVDGRTLKVLRDECELPEAVRGQTLGVGVVTPSRLLLPVGRSLVDIDLRQWRAPAYYRLAVPGSLLALDGQIIVAGHDRIYCYMNWAQAYDRLKRRIDQDEPDPAPALALAYMALNAGQPQHVLEGADAALQSLSRREPGRPIEDQWRRRVFAQLIALVQDERAAKMKLRRDLFDRLAAATSGPADTVAYHFALGEFLEETDKLQDAIEHYQLILMDTALSEQSYRWQSGWRTAGVEARLRQQHLIERRPGIYERYDAMAGQQLAHLQASTEAHPHDYVDLAQRYPLSAVAPKALAAAASKYVQAEQPDAARRTLALIAHRYPKHEPIGDIGLMSAATGLDQADEDNTGSSSTPRLALPLGPVLQIKGRLLTPTAQPRSAWPRNLYVVHDGQTLQLCRGRHFDSQWSVMIADGEVDLLAITPDQLLAYHRSSGHIIGLHTATGEPAWPPVAVRALLDQVASRSTIHSDEPAGDIMLAVNGQMICFSDYEGRVVGVERRTGRATWGRACNFGKVRQFQINDRVLVVACGRPTSEVAARPGAVIALDPVTGQDRFDPKLLTHRPIWVGLGQGTAVICATAGKVTSYRARDGELNWYVNIPGSPLLWANQVLPGRAKLLTDKLVGGHPSGSLLLLAGAAGAWHLVDTDLGRYRKPPISNPMPGHSPLVSIKAHGGQWHLLGPRGAAALDDQGRVLWRDAIEGDAKQLIAQFVTDDHVLVLAHEPTSAPGDNGADALPHRYRLHALESRSGRLVDQYELDPLAEPIDRRRSGVHGSRLMLVTPSATLIISGANERDQ